MLGIPALGWKKAGEIISNGGLKKIFENFAKILRAPIIYENDVPILQIRIFTLFEYKVNSNETRLEGQESQWTPN